MVHVQSKQAYIQGFDCEIIPFQKSVNIFEHMEITEIIYKVLVEFSYENYFIRC